MVEADILPAQRPYLSTPHSGGGREDDGRRHERRVVVVGDETGDILAGEGRTSTSIVGEAAHRIAVVLALD